MLGLKSLKMWRAKRLLEKIDSQLEQYQQEHEALKKQVSSGGDYSYFYVFMRHQQVWMNEQKKQMLKISRQSPSFAAEISDKIIKITEIIQQNNAKKQGEMKQAQQSIDNKIIKEQTKNTVTPETIIKKLESQLRPSFGITIQGVDENTDLASILKKFNKEQQSNLIPGFKIKTPPLKGMNENKIDKDSVAQFDLYKNFRMFPKMFGYKARVEINQDGDFTIYSKEDPRVFTEQFAAMCKMVIANLCEKYKDDPDQLATKLNKLKVTGSPALQQELQGKLDSIRDSANGNPKQFIAENLPNSISSSSSQSPSSSSSSSPPSPSQ